MAELSQYLGFLIIFKDSFKLIFKNVKFMSAITLLSLLLSSTILLVFCYTYIFLTQTMNSEYLPIMAFLIFFLGIISFAKTSRLSVIATVLVSATSYTDTVMSYQDLYSGVKTTSKRSKAFGYRTSSQRGTGILATLVIVGFIFMAIFHPNPVTITITVVVGVSVFAFKLYTSVPSALSSVVSIIEEKYEGSEALERAQELIEGQRQHGFIITLFINCPFLVVLLGFLFVLGDKLWSVDAVWFWLILVNFSILSIIYGGVAYTVLYFRCKKHHEELVGNFGYSILPASSNLDDAGIP